MSAPLINDYKVKFTIKRIIENVTGGFRIVPAGTTILHTFLVVTITLIFYFIPFTLNLINHFISLGFVYAGVATLLIHGIIRSILYVMNRNNELECMDESSGYIENDDPLSGNPFSSAFIFIFWSSETKGVFPVTTSTLFSSVFIGCCVKVFGLDYFQIS
jgi:hypothetical protein